jgi:Fe-S-cluster containining protein
LIVNIEQADLDREPRLLPVVTPRVDDITKEPNGEYTLALGGSNPCPFIGGDNRCGIYETRPDVCRTFLAGSTYCQKLRELAGLPRLRPIKPGKR